MATRTITQTTEKQINVCDLCNKAIGHCQKCYVCRREVGYCCSRFVKCHEDGAPAHIDLCFTICGDCDDASKHTTGIGFIELLRSHVSACDVAIANNLERWQEWSKEWREATPEQRARWRNP